MSDLQSSKGSLALKKKNNNQNCCHDAIPMIDNILITSLGNPLCGDDGVSTLILEKLATSSPFPKNVSFQFDGSPVRLMDALLTKRHKVIIIIDSAFIDRLPGEWLRFNLEDIKFVRINRNTKLSMHDFGLAEVLELCNELDIQLPDVIFYGVQPEEVNWSYKLSSKVQEAVPTVCASILEDLQEYGIALNIIE